jgi:hypothetical protein
MSSLLSPNTWSERLFSRCCLLIVRDIFSRTCKRVGDVMALCSLLFIILGSREKDMYCGLNGNRWSLNLSRYHFHTYNIVCLLLSVPIFEVSYIFKGIVSYLHCTASPKYLILLWNFGSYLIIGRAYCRTLEYILHTKSRNFRVSHWYRNTHKTTLRSRGKNALRVLQITIIFSPIFILYTT